MQDAMHNAFSIRHSSMLIIINVTPSSCSIWRQKLLTLYQFIVNIQICIQQNPNFVKTPYTNFHEYLTYNLVTDTRISGLLDGQGLHVGCSCLPHNTCKAICTRVKVTFCLLIIFFCCFFMFLTYFFAFPQLSFSCVHHYFPELPQKRYVEFSLYELRLQWKSPHLSQFFFLSLIYSCDKGMNSVHFKMN